MSWKILLHELFCVDYHLGKSWAGISKINTNSSINLLEKGYWKGKRPANWKELEAFAKKYQPARWYPPILAIDPQITETLFGPEADVYQTIAGTVKRLEVNPFWGLPTGSLVLFVEEDRN